MCSAAELQSAVHRAVLVPTVTSRPGNSPEHTGCSRHPCSPGVRGEPQRKEHRARTRTPRLKIRTCNQGSSVHCRVVLCGRGKSASVSRQYKASKHLMLCCVDAPYCAWYCSGSMGVTGDSTLTHRQPLAHSVHHTTRTLPCL